MRRMDGTYRISVQLVDVETGINIWSRSHEVLVSNEFEAQIRVADEIAHRIHRTFEAENERQIESGMQLNLGRF